MADRLTEQQKADLLKSFDPAKVAEENAAMFGKKPKEKATEFSRPPVVVRPSGVGSPKGWFPKGKVTGADEEQY